MVFSLSACSSNKDVGSGGASNAPNQTTDTVAQIESKTEKPTETQTETPTEKSTELKYFTEEIDLTRRYISPENCKRIADMLDGVTIKEGDAIDLNTIPFTEAELQGKYLLTSKLGRIIVSDMKTGVFVLTSQSSHDIVFKITYDDKYLYIAWAYIK